ncbi:MAG: carboxypeptidase-like regulatory domain-containing protein, partial [Bacteroidales bacterium]|nr:carboxypeptidase-like regulatory domain-containing protein [Bacteroidales bacterium]
MKSKFFFALLILLPTLINAQVTGTVYEFSDNKKIPLFGVNIYWENTQTGTSTDEKGQFKIQKPTNS